MNYINGNYRTTWIVGCILLIQAVWLGRTFNSMLLMAATVTITACIVAERLRREQRRERRNDPRQQLLELQAEVTFPVMRTLLVSLIAVVGAVAIAALRSLEYLGTNFNAGLVAADIVAHESLLASAVIFAVWPRSGHPMLVPMGVIVALVSVIAGGASQTLNGQTAAAMAFTVILLAGSQVTGGSGRSSVTGLLTNKRSVLAAQATDRLKWLLSLAIVSLILIVTSALASTTSEVLPDIQTQLTRQLRDSLEAIQVDSSVNNGQYVEGTRFGSVRRSIQLSPNGTALRVYAATAPGYLRGRAYDVFHRRRWLNAEMAGFINPRNFQADQRSMDEFNQRLDAAENRSIFSVVEGPGTTTRTEPVLPEMIASRFGNQMIAPSGPGVTRTIGPRSRDLRRFIIREPSGTRSSLRSITTIEIHNEPMKGAVFFTPLTSEWIEAASRSLMISEHSIVLGGIDATQPYVVGVAENVAPRSLPEPIRETLLYVPESIARVVDLVVTDELTQVNSPTAKADKIRRFFQRNFAYSLDEPPAAGRDQPIEYFLQTRHPAHCEYFATATALILRRAGVPTRYVTGYVADEMNSDDDYWLAKNSDAHAWVEAYDDQSQTWFPVESTPGRSYQSISTSTDFATGGSGGDFNGGDTDQGERSVWSHVRYWWNVMWSSDSLMLTFRILQVPLAMLVLALLWWRRCISKRETIDPNDLESRRRLSRVDRRMRRVGLVRRPHETLHQFAQRVQESESVSPEKVTRERFANWYREFANARYQGLVPIAWE